MRRLRRLRRRRLLIPLATLGGLTLVAIAWCAWLATSAAGDLREAERRAEVMRAALVRGDADGARAALADYQRDAEAAEDKTSGITWSAIEAVPVLGDDASGIEVVAHVLAEIGRDGLPPVADAADQVTADAFQPQGHRFPLAQIAAMEEPAAQSEEAFDRAAADLAEVDSAAFLPAVQERFDDLRRLVNEARSTLDSTYRAARLMPRLLGEDGPRNYLLVLQNNAEIRSTGGLPGSLSLVRADRGTVDIVEQRDMASLERSAGNTILPVTAEERRLFGRILGQAGVDATLTPDIPRAAELIRARWERFHGGRVDGVFFVDPVAVSYLLRGTGPVAVPGAQPVTADNVVAMVENEIYSTSNDPQAHSDYQNAVAEAVFDTFADGRGDTAQSIRGLVSGVLEGRVRMHSFRAEDQTEIAGTTIAGEFPRQSDGRPTVGLYLNDGGPTKMQYYLRYDAAVFARACAGGVQDLSGFIEFHNDTPDNPESLADAITGEFFPGNRTDPGEQIVVMYLTSPIGGQVSELSIEGQRVGRPVVSDFAGREVATVEIRLGPQERQRIDFVLRSGRGQTGDVDLAVTPGASPGSPNGTAPSAC